MIDNLWIAICLSYGAWFFLLIKLYKNRNEIDELRGYLVTVITQQNSINRAFLDRIDIIEKRQSMRMVK
jgi:hypothetical protein